MERIRRIIGRVISFVAIAATSYVLLIASASAQTFVTPGQNTNVVGKTLNPDHIPDDGLKQQQEPSCIVQPTNPSHIMCAFNDLRAADKPAQGDAWIGYGMSGDKGQTWISGLVPGFATHPNSLGMGFAADPSLVAIPGADTRVTDDDRPTPGLAVLNYIAGFRDSSVGVLAIQRFVENAQEDQLFWLPENEIYIIADGTSGRFIDKPAFLFIPDDPGSQRVRTETVYVEGRSAPVTVKTPAGTLVVAYAVFTGSSSIKVIVQESRDNGRTWTNGTKLSESQNEVTGVTLTAIGQTVVAAWRRKGDNNEGDAILSAVSANAGKRWSKGEVMFNLCPFDQPATSASFRSFAFPWAANDGKRFWTFAADRRYQEQGGETTTCEPFLVDGEDVGIYEGIPRIVGMSSVDGINWFGNADEPARPFVLDESLGESGRPLGYQVMPSAFGTKGRIDIAWYDTRREAIVGLPFQGASADEPQIPLILDYLTAEWDAEGFPASLAKVMRKADVRMTRLTADCPASGGCTPSIEDSVQVSNYPVTFVDVGAGADVAIETEAHLPNQRLYASGTIAFKGDYIAIATPGLRTNADGRWISNSLPEQADDALTYTDKEDVFVAWGDNRDVRIESAFANNFGQVPYTPAPEPGSATLAGFKSGEIMPGASEPLFMLDRELLAVTESDDSSDPEVPGDLGTCGSGTNFSRSRDANIYGAVVVDSPALSSPTPSKPLGSIQRMFPLVLNNPDPVNPKNFCLVIENQPIGSPSLGRASFLQLPSVPPFDFDGAPLPLTRIPVSVPPSSTASRAVFIVGGDSSVVHIGAYEDGENDTPELCVTGADLSGNVYSGELQNTIAISDGNLFDSAYCLANPDEPACVLPDGGVTVQETHDISLALSNLQAPVLKAPVTEALSYQNLSLQAPALAALSFQNLSWQNLSLQNLSLQNLSYQNLSWQNLSWQNLSWQNLSLQNLSLQNLSYQNLSWQNLSLQNLSLQNLSFQAPTLTDDNGDEEVTAEENLYAGVQADDAWYQDITYVVETNANVTTTYSADISMDTSSLRNDDGEDEVVVQLIAWTPNEVNSSTTLDENCEQRSGFQAQVISAVTLNALSLQAVNLPEAFTPTEEGDPDYGRQNPFAGEISFTGKPNQPIALTVRVWATGQAVEKLKDLHSDTTNANSWLSCMSIEGNTLEDCDGAGIGGLITFGASAQGCKTNDTDPDKPDDYVPDTDCLDSEEKILQDRQPPSVNPVNPPEGFTPENLPYELDPDASQLKVTWPISGTDTDAANVTIVCTIDGVDYEPLEDPPYDIGEDTFTATFDYWFDAGETPVSCSVTDGAGNTATVSFTVTVDDVTGPVFGALPNPNAAGDIEATGPTGAVVSWGTVTAIDVVDGEIEATCVPASGSTFPIGTTEVTCTATDSATWENEATGATGPNSTTATFTVTVSDNTAPVITAPTNVTTEATGAQTSVAIGTATATDAVGPVTITSDAPASFPVGDTIVTWTATDYYYNSSTATQTITVVDSTAPAITAPADVSVEATGVLTVVEIGTATASDAVDTLVMITNDAPESFPLGSTTVTWTATDDYGNWSIATQTVTVVDSTAPTITAPADVSVEATGALTIVDIGTATATDAVDASVTITSDAPASFPVGITTVIWTATDDDGNSSSATQTVTVVDTTGPAITAPNVTLSADYVKPTLDDPSRPVVPDLADLSDYDLASTVTALDVVEGSVGVSCNRRYGQGTNFHFGDHVIDCTATDGTYSTSASFTLTVRYLYDIELILPKGRARAGSTIPIDWQYLSWDAPFDPVNSPNDMVADPENHISVRWIKSAECSGVIDPDGTSGEDAGSSDFRYSSADQLWQFSWQTPSLPGDYILTISPPGTLLVPGQPLPNSSACVVLR